MLHRRRGVSAVLALATVLAGCAAPPALSERDGRVQVVTTTGLLRDLVQHVGGDRVNVTSLVPDGGDPHSYEPSLRDVRNVVYADVAFSSAGTYTVTFQISGTLTNGTTISDDATYTFTVQA